MLVCVMGNPVVQYKLCGSTLALPLSHQLPEIRQRYPFYSSNIARISYCVKSKYPALTFIDIGANVGDTVAIVREIAEFPILCIDGDPEFGALLEMNAQGWQAVTVERTFVNTESGISAGKIERKGGTAHLVLDEVVDATIQSKTLASILRRHPQFERSKLIKLDTDGMDCKILIGAKDLLKVMKPVLFFEYDPYYSEKFGQDSFEVFEILRELGYSKLMIFENTGHYLISIDLSSEILLQDIHHFFSGWHGQRYCDICAFHLEDEDIWSAARSMEMKSATQAKPDAHRI